MTTLMEEHRRENKNLGTISRPGATLKSALQKSARLITILGAVMMLLGLFAIMAPGIAGLTVTITLGALILAAGITRAVFAFRTHAEGAGLAGFVLSAIAIICGGYMLLHPAANLIALTLLLSGYLIVEGVAEIIYALRFKPLAGWGWMLCGGVVGIALGLMIGGHWPFSGVWAIGTLIGAGLLFRGVSFLQIGLGASRLLGPKR